MDSLFQAIGDLLSGISNDPSDPRLSITDIIILCFLAGGLVRGVSFLLAGESLVINSVLGFVCLLLFPVLTSRCLTILFDYRLRQNKISIDDPFWRYHRRAWSKGAASFVFGVIFVLIVRSFVNIG